jgi:hypothetical protein
VGIDGRHEHGGDAVVAGQGHDGQDAVGVPQDAVEAPPSGKRYPEFTKTACSFPSALP